MLKLSNIDTIDSLDQLSQIRDQIEKYLQKLDDREEYLINKISDEEKDDEDIEEEEKIETVFNFHKITPQEKQNGVIIEEILVGDKVFNKCSNHSLRKLFGDKIFIYANKDVGIFLGNNRTIYTQYEDDSTLINFTCDFIKNNLTKIKKNAYFNIGDINFLNKIMNEKCSVSRTLTVMSPRKRKN